MRLAAHETLDLHELTLSCANTISLMGLFVNHAQDAELKSMLLRHYPYHIRDYNKKVAFLQKQKGSQVPLPIPPLNPTLTDFAQASRAELAPPAPPRTSVQIMTDREIATAYLTELKRVGREAGYAIFEMANPQVRTSLEEGLLLCSHHAYDVWQYMVKWGFYPLLPAPQIELQTVASMYAMIPETVTPPSPVM